MTKSRNSRWQKPICIIMPYFGKWPVWIELFMETCKHNPTVDWLFFTDTEEPENKCDNVRFIKMSLGNFGKLVSSKLGFQINFPYPYKICDVRPSFGVIFEEYLHN